MWRGRTLPLPTEAVGFASMYSLELSERELRLVRSAVRSFLEDFGHDEADLLRELKELLEKLPDPDE
jgi:hypothetical protein